MNRCPDTITRLILAALLGVSASASADCAAADDDPLKPTLIARGPDYEIRVEGHWQQRRFIHKRLSSGRERVLLAQTARRASSREPVVTRLAHVVEGVVVDDERLYVLSALQTSARVSTPAARADRTVTNTAHILTVYWLEDGTRIYRQDVTELSDGTRGTPTLQHGLLTPVEEGIEFAGAVIRFDGSSIAGVQRNDELINLSRPPRGIG